MAIHRRLAHFRGRVQGVGFRVRTVRLASGFDVAGTVRNLADGSVEVVVEGEAAELDRFLEALHREFSGKIAGSSSEIMAAVEPLEGFTILY